MEELFSNLSWNRKIEILRLMKGWTQREASERCLTTQKAYWEWEKGITTPRGSNKIIIARAFGIPVEQIF